MTKSPKTFISYNKPVRCKRTLIEIVATLAFGALGFGFAASSIPKVLPQSIVFAVASLIIGLVSSFICMSLLWSFAMGRIHFVHVSDEGVGYDGKKWSWSSVTSIRSTSVLPNGAAYLAVSVTRGPFRTRLTLPIEVRLADPMVIINELKQYLIAAGYSIPWRSIAA